jgi:hypothetical protein
MLKHNTLPHRKMKSLVATTILAIATIAQSAQAATITTTNNASELVSKLLGTSSGITVVGTPTLIGDPSQSGIFNDGNTGTRLGIDSGIILSTGRAANAIGSYNINVQGDSFNANGDPQLTALVTDGSPTVDPASLSFNFTTDTGNLYFLNYVFASQEYPQYVGSQFNDIFAFFIDGVNVATIPGTNQPVSINTINAGGNVPASNPSLYIPNSNNARTLEFGGLTVPLTARAINLSPGIHSFKLAIADVADAALNSAVFLSSNGISSTPVYQSGGSGTPVPEPFTIIGTLIGMGVAVRSKLKKVA